MNSENESSIVNINDIGAFESVLDFVNLRYNFAVAVDKNLPYFDGVKRMILLRQGVDTGQGTLSKMMDLMRFGGHFSVLSAGFSASDYSFRVVDKNGRLLILFSTKT